MYITEVTQDRDRVFIGVACRIAAICGCNNSSWVRRQSTCAEYTDDDDRRPQQTVAVETAADRHTAVLIEYWPSQPPSHPSTTQRHVSTGRTADRWIAVDHTAERERDNIARFGRITFRQISGNNVWQKISLSLLSLYCELRRLATTTDRELLFEMNINTPVNHRVLTTETRIHV